MLPKLTISSASPIRSKSSWASRDLIERAFAYFQIRFSGSLAILLAMLVTQKFMPTYALKTAIIIVLVDMGILLLQRFFIARGKPFIFTWGSLISAALIGTIGMHFGGGSATLSLGVYMILILSTALVFLKQSAAFWMTMICVVLYGTIVFVEFSQILPPHNRIFNIIYIQEARLFLANTLLGLVLLFVTMSLSGKAAEALGQWSIQLEDKVDRKSRDLQNLIAKQENTLVLLQKSYDETLQGWAKILEMRDKETEGHSERVTSLAVRMAQAMGIQDETEIQSIRYGSLLHDIGKIAISDSILHKPDKLTLDERKIMEQHTEYAYHWLKDVEFLRPSLDIPRYHHEKWDGSGYCHGLKAEQIPTSARIFAVADCWDALINDRAYRKAWTWEESMDYIKKQSGKDFDPQVVEKFVEIMKDRHLLADEKNNTKGII